MALFSARDMQPKWHYSFHLPDQLPLINCWSLEQKHRVAKKWSNEVRNTACDYEITVLREVTVRHLDILATSEHFTSNARLINPRVPTNSLMQSLQMLTGLELDSTNCKSSRTVQFNEIENCSIGDVVLFKARDGKPFAAGQAVVHFEVADPSGVHLASLLQQWDFVSTTPRCSKWSCSESKSILILSEDIICTTIWSRSGHHARILLPIRCRL